MEEKKTVLIVEDEKSIVDIVRFNLEKEGWEGYSSPKGRKSPATAPVSSCSSRMAAAVGSSPYSSFPAGISRRTFS